MGRVAIAGILASGTRFCIGRADSRARSLLEEKGIDSCLRHYIKSLVLVTHTMDDGNKFADTVFALEAGKLVLNGPQVFQQVEYLQKLQLEVPQIGTYLKIEQRPFPGQTTNQN